MAPVLAIAGMVARTTHRCSSDPVGETFQTYRHRAEPGSISRGEGRDDDGKSAMAKSEREKGMGTTSAGRGSGSGDGPSTSRRDRKSSLSRLIYSRFEFEEVRGYPDG